MTAPTARVAGVLAATLMLLLAAGCTNDPAEDAADADSVPEVASPEPEDSPEPAVPSPSPEATEPPDEEETEEPEAEETPPPVDEPAPELELVGDDYEQVVRSHTAFSTWLFRHPDPERFDDITHPDCECYVQKDLLAHYEDEGLRWTGGEEGIQVRRVEVVDDQARNMVHLEVVFERPEGGELVDEDGEVHDEVEPREPWVEDLVFVREDESANWKLRDFVDRGPLNGDDDA